MELVLLHALAHLHLVVDGGLETPMVFGGVLR